MIYLCNAVSFHMLTMRIGDHRTLEVDQITAAEAGELLRSHPFRSFYGHGRSAYHLARYLRVSIPVSRGAIRLGPGDLLLVAAIDSKRVWIEGVRGCPRWTFYLAECRGNSAADRNQTVSNSQRGRDQQRV